MAKPDSSMVLAESQAIIDANTLLRTPLEYLDIGTAVVAWSVLDLLEKNVIKDRKAALRRMLMEIAEIQGVETASGSYVFNLDGAKITKQCRKGKATINLGQLRQLLARKAICEDTCIRTVYEVDEKGIENLLKSEQISLEEIREISEVQDPTYALTVKKPPQVLALLP